MMKILFKAFFALVLLCVSFESSAQELDCTKYKTGKFLVPNDEFGDTHVVRTATKQTETGVDNTTGKKFKAVFSVVWINDCLFELTLVKQKNSGIPPGSPPIKIRILETYADSYLVGAVGYPDMAPMLVEVEK